jgi:Tol biopolymer transport system component
MRGVGLGGLVLFAACDGVFNLRVVADGGPGLDAPRVCEAGTPFPTGTQVPIDGSYSVEAARFAPDRSYAHLALCPANGNKLGCDLYLSQFSTELGEFTQHLKMNGVSSPTFYDSYPTFTPDGSYILFGSDRTALHLWVATKTNGSFEAPTLTQLALAGEQRANEPYLVGGGQTLYFAATLGTATINWDLYRATGGPPSFSPAIQVAGTVSPDDEQAPVVSADERELFFSSDRHAPNVADKLDIYTATRSDPSQAFSMPVQVPAVSQDGGNDWPVWLSPDGCDLYYINKTAGVSTLYVSRR